MHRLFLLATALLLIPACKSEAPAPKSPAPAETPKQAEAPPEEAPSEEPKSEDKAPAQAPESEEKAAGETGAAEAVAPPADLEEAGFDKQVASLEERFEAALEGRPLEAPVKADPMRADRWPRPCEGLDSAKHMRVKDLDALCVTRDLVALTMAQGKRFTGMPSSYSDDDPIGVFADPVGTLGEISALTKSERETARLANRKQLYFVDLPLDSCQDVPNETHTGREVNCDFSADLLHVSEGPRIVCEGSCETQTSSWSPQLEGDRLTRALESLKPGAAGARLLVGFEMTGAWRKPWPANSGMEKTHTGIHGLISPFVLARVQCSAAPCTAENMSDVQVIHADDIRVAVHNGPHAARIECESPTACTATLQSL